MKHFLLLRKPVLPFFLRMLGFVLISSPGYSQCSRVAPAAGNCTTGTQIVNGNTYSFGSGSYYYNGSGATATVKMTNGGTLSVCGILTLTTSSTFNLSGGTIVVESGGELTVNCDITLNNTGRIVNRGKLIVNGNIKATHQAATIWNLPGAVGFTVTAGHKITMQSNSYFINSASYTSVVTPTLDLAGGFLCMGDISVVSVQNFISTSQNNAVIYSGTTFPACLFVSNAGTINGHTVTNSSSIYAKLAPGYTYASGTPANWGSATIVNNATSCSSFILPVSSFSNVSATEEKNAITIKWKLTEASKNGEIFQVERSEDEVGFQKITEFTATEGLTEFVVYDTKLTSENQYYRIKRKAPGGVYEYSKITVVKTGFIPKLSVYPNPVSPTNTLMITFLSPGKGSAVLSLVDFSGKTIISKNSTLINGINNLNFNLNHIAPGNYILRIQRDNSAQVFKKIMVL